MDTVQDFIDKISCTRKARAKINSIANQPAAIDMLAMLAEKTRGNLSLEEQRLLENSLTELRFRYVQISENAAKSAATPKPESEGEK